MYRIIYLLLLTTVIIISGYSQEREINNDAKYEIIFWNFDRDSIDNNNSDALNAVTYSDIQNYMIIHFVISSECVLEYYWDIQTLIFNWDQVVKECGYFPSYGYFSVAIDNKIIFTGLNRTNETAYIFQEDRIIAPVIQTRYVDEEFKLLYIKPSYVTQLKEDKKSRDIIAKVNTQDIFDFFNNDNKLIRGPLPDKYRNTNIIEIDVEE